MPGRVCVNSKGKKSEGKQKHQKYNSAQAIDCIENSPEKNSGKLDTGSLKHWGSGNTRSNGRKDITTRYSEC